MPLYCMDFRNYTTLRDAKKLLDYDTALAAQMKEGNEEIPVDWCLNEMSYVAKRLDIVIENLYVKPYEKEN